MHEKITVICPEHGEFQITPSKHLLGQGCRKCGIIQRSMNRTKTYEDFAKDARKVHGNKYDYSESVYNGCRNLIKIK